MKFLKFLLSNFQILNFLIASVIMGIIYLSIINPSPDNLSPTADNQTTQPENYTPPPEEQTTQNPNYTNPSTQTEKELQSPTNETSTPENQNSSKTTKLVNPNLPEETYLGHFPYQEASQNRLKNVGKYYDRTEYLDQETARAFEQMKKDAKKQGVDLVLISGFRPVSVQKELFAKQVEKKGSEEAAAKLSAPPGYSEHHTGYAVDIGDASQPEADLKFAFEYTPAYNWLINNAKRYGFELSFPKNNAQGVSFEPWHWRYVDSSRAVQIFKLARTATFPAN